MFEAIFYRFPGATGVDLTPSDAVIEYDITRRATILATFTVSDNEFLGSGKIELTYDGNFLGDFFLLDAHARAPGVTNIILGDSQSVLANEISLSGIQLGAMDLGAAINIITGLSESIWLGNLTSPNLGIPINGFYAPPGVTLLDAIAELVFEAGFSGLQVVAGQWQLPMLLSPVNAEPISEVVHTTNLVSRYNRAIVAVRGSNSAPSSFYVADLDPTVEGSFELTGRRTARMVTVSEGSMDTAHNLLESAAPDNLNFWISGQPGAAPLIVGGATTQILRYRYYTDTNVSEVTCAIR